MLRGKKIFKETEKQDHAPLQQLPSLQRSKVGKGPLGIMPRTLRCQKCMLGANGACNTFRDLKAHPKPMT